MKMSWNKLNSFSFKDLVSIVLTLLFVGTVTLTIINYFKSKDLALISLVQAQLSIILAIIAAYSSSEVITYITPMLRQGKEIVELSQNIIPKVDEQTSQTVINNTSIIQTPVVEPSSPNPNTDTPYGV